MSIIKRNGLLTLSPATPLMILAEQQKWDEKDALASAKLRAMCSTKVQQILNGTSDLTSHQKYEILKERCARSSLAAKWAALSKLAAVKYSDCKDTREMASRIRSMGTEINNLDVSMDDILLFTFLNNLGPEWTQYRTVLNDETRKKESLDFDRIVKGLMDHEWTMKWVKGPSKVKDSKTPTFGTPGTFGTPSTPCSCCGLIGHKKADCMHKDKKCHGCGKKGHMKNVCRSRNIDNNNTNTTFKVLLILVALGKMKGLRIGTSPSNRHSIATMTIAMPLQMTRKIHLNMSISLRKKWTITNCGTDDRDSWDTPICGERLAR